MARQNQIGNLPPTQSHKGRYVLCRAPKGESRLWALSRPTSSIDGEPNFEEPKRSLSDALATPVSIGEITRYAHYSRVQRFPPCQEPTVVLSFPLKDIPPCPAQSHQIPETPGSNVNVHPQPQLTPSLLRKRLTGVQESGRAISGWLWFPDIFCAHFSACHSFSFGCQFPRAGPRTTSVALSEPSARSPI